MQHAANQIRTIFSIQTLTTYYPLLSFHAILLFFGFLNIQIFFCYFSFQKLKLNFFGSIKFCLYVFAYELLESFNKLINLIIHNKTFHQRFIFFSSFVFACVYIYACASYLLLFHILFRDLLILLLL